MLDEHQVPSEEFEQKTTYKNLAAYLQKKQLGQKPIEALENAKFFKKIDWNIAKENDK